MTDYQKYQLQWMIDHDHPLDELIDELDRCQMDWADDKETVANTYEAWEHNIGFGSEIWACEKEWEDYEKLDHSERMELMGTLVDIVEDWLEEKGITQEHIKSEDRDQAIKDGDDPNDLAIIYGEDYDILTGALEKTLIDYGLLNPENFDV